MELNRDERYILTHLADEHDHYFGSVVPPLFMTSLHVFDSLEHQASINVANRDDYAYGRVANPTTRVLEDKVAALERAKHALCFASGMAATSCAILSHCKAGDHIICIRNIYGCVKGFIDQCLVPNYQMSVTYVMGDCVEEIEESIRANTTLIILESPSSLVFRICDLRQIATMAKNRGIKTMIDNSYSTPLYQKPLELGIDMVMHTATKYFSGHSDCLGGLLVSNDTAWMDRIFEVERQYLGAVIGPMEAWLIIRGLRTLDVRLERHSKTAMRIAEYLDEHPRIKKVYYPALPTHSQHELMNTQQTGNCGLLSFEIDGSQEDAEKLVNHLKLFRIGVSWGGFESLVSMPMRNLTKEEAEWYGASPALIRIHAGLEGEELLLADLEQALDTIIR